ncbi:DUF2849 domain-containing protein [Pannonibacter sp. Pt2-lr]|uniref:DUF2849 domain-containing protein n=1 Tax=Pannonibacter anstelovis TaxID=3121537 RepID=A0ABU7ZQQ6_9HYPH
MKVITANRLIDGEVVFQGENGAWVELIGEARLLEGKDAVAEALALAAKSVASREIVDPYDIEIKDEDGKRVPERLREKIRAAGPTTHPALGKQARS